MTGKRKFFRRPARKVEWTPAATRNAIVAWARQNDVDPAVFGSAVLWLGIDLSKAAKVSLEQFITAVQEAWNQKVGS